MIVRMNVTLDNSDISSCIGAYHLVYMQNSRYICPVMGLYIISKIRYVIYCFSVDTNVAYYACTLLWGHVLLLRIYRVIHPEDCELRLG